jgi:ribosomal protein S18 acetylase RimI-like enzyme
MEIEDYDSVSALWSKIDGIVLTDTDEKRLMQVSLSRNQGLSLVAYCGDELAGAVLCSQDGRRGYIHHLAVRKEFRRYGIGSGLV